MPITSAMMVEVPEVAADRDADLLGPPAEDLAEIVQRQLFRHPDRRLGQDFAVGAEGRQDDPQAGQAHDQHQDEGQDRQPRLLQPLRALAFDPPHCAPPI
jgi:hypothetical protein